MWRAVLEAVVPFLIPFALYAFWLAAMRRFSPKAAGRAPGDAPDREPWPWIWLSCIGLVLAFGLLVFTSERNAIGTNERYTPARLTDGTILPGGAAPR
jgi:drug/metabolite transporter (DMT)-like permease